MQIRSRTSALFLLACLIGAVGMLVTSCATTSHEPKWVEGIVETPNEIILGQVTIHSLTKVGFPIGTGISSGKLGGVSGWNTSLAPFKSEGFRERCYVEYTPLGGKRYQIRARVERETNEDIMHPLDLSYADWTPAPDNDTRAQLVVAQVKAFLTPEFKSTARQDAEAASPKQ
jgi:hypothetical protein